MNKNKNKNKVNWGIIGCGAIANTFATSLSVVDDGIITACAAGNVDRAKAFAKRHNIAKAHADYASLLTDDEIDAVYIATTHNFHFAQIMQCLHNGKHVLCEKPLTINAKQAEQVQLAAHKNKLLVLEAVWTRFLPAIEALKQCLINGSIGTIKSLYANFSINLDITNEHRLLNPNLAGGALLDLGIYPITFADIVFNNAPKTAVALANMADTGVDEASNYLFGYAGGAAALLSAGFRQSAPVEAIIQGDLGYIKVPNFLGAKSFELTLDNQPSQFFEFDFKDEHCFSFEINHFHKCLQQGLSDSPILPLSKSLEIISLMDNLRAQFGLVYEGD